MKIRVKFGKNPYGNHFFCSRCGSSFESGGFTLRIEHEGNYVEHLIMPSEYLKPGGTLAM